MFKYLILVIILFQIWIPVYGSSYFQGSPKAVLLSESTSTATSAGTLTLTKNSNEHQFFSGVLTHSVVLPDATTLQLYRRFLLSNKSTGAVTVKYNDASTALVLAADSSAWFYLKDKSTANGVWEINSSSSSSGANTSLSNLTDPATVNSADFIFTGTAPVIHTISGATSQIIVLKSGDTSGGVSGVAQLKSGDVVGNFSSGNVLVQPGVVSGTASSGQMNARSSDNGTVGAGGTGDATTRTGNLTSSTATGTTGAWTSRSGNNLGLGNSGNSIYNSGSVLSGTSGNVNSKSGSATSGTSGTYGNGTGNTTGANPSGNMSSFTGGTSGTGNTGSFTFGTGTATGSGQSGTSAYVTGNAVNATGGIGMNSGNSSAGLSGQLTIATGTALTTSGPLFIQPGTASSAGQLRLTGGTSTGSTGGLLNLVGGASTVGNGGGVDIVTGVGATNFNSGSFSWRTDNATGTGNSGDITVNAGTVVSGIQGIMSIDARHLTLNSKQIKNVSDPTSNQDAATKFYVDNNSLTNPLTTTGDIIYASGAVATRLAIGTTGQVLTVSGSGLPVWASSSAGSFTAPNIQSFPSNTSGTYTTPVNALYLRVRMAGGGGGGAGSGVVGEAQTDGSAGTNSTFGTAFLTASGGAGGLASGGGPGEGGAASITTAKGLAFYGGSGSDAIHSFANRFEYCPGGSGGINLYGGRTSGTNAGFLTDNGSGGMGGGVSSSSTQKCDPGSGGGAGGAIDALVYSPSASYGFVTGAGGSNGVAGASGNDGRIGAGGFIEITAFYQ